MRSLRPGQIVWVDLGGAVGREQAGRRPCLVVSSSFHLHGVTTLATIVPCTTRGRGWENHVPLDGPTGLDQPTFAMTEQIRTMSRLRIHREGGLVSHDCLAQVSRWLDTWHRAA